MVLSFLLLTAFSGRWLQLQYQQQEARLGQELQTLFTGLQSRITDSLLLVRFINPALQRPINRAEAANPVLMQGMRQSLGSLSRQEAEELFRLDTLAFRQAFAEGMQSRGWRFQARWTKGSDASAHAGQIFIPSRYFTTDHGVLVSGYQPYLLAQLLPELLFVLALLVICGLALGATYRSLRAQMRLSRLKDEFVSSMSHELKTPIATVKVALEALDTYELMEQPELRREYLQMARHEVERLELLAGRALHTSLAASGRLMLQPEACDLSALARQVVQAMSLRTQQLGATITIEEQGSRFEVMADKLHTQGVLVNLLDNSLKYAGSQPHIRILLRSGSQGVELSVSDNGPGIPGPYQKRVFERFFRLPAERTNRGFGLGLSYAAQVMAQQRGRIALKQAPGGGCMFTLSF